jgi:hypothetical protein
MSHQDDNPKTIYGNAKPPMHLVPAASTLHEAMAFGDGAAKYGPYNWREKTVSASTYIGAALRHIAAWFDGENIDPVSKVHHLGHAKACLGIILDAQLVENLNDDRPPMAPTGLLIVSLTRKMSPSPEVEGTTFTLEQALRQAGIDPNLMVGKDKRCADGGSK